MSDSNTSITGPVITGIAMIISAFITAGYFKSTIKEDYVKKTDVEEYTPKTENCNSLKSELTKFQKSYSKLQKKYDILESTCNNNNTSVTTNFDSHIIEKNGFEIYFRNFTRSRNNIHVFIVAKNLSDVTQRIQVFPPGQGRINTVTQLYDDKSRKQPITDIKNMKIADQHKTHGVAWAGGLSVYQEVLSGREAVIDLYFEVDKNFGNVDAIEVVFGKGSSTFEGVFAHTFTNIGQE